MVSCYIDQNWNDLNVKMEYSQRFHIDGNLNEKEETQSECKNSFFCNLFFTFSLGKIQIISGSNF